MTDDLRDSLAQWLAAEAAGRDDDADAAFTQAVNAGALAQAAEAPDERRILAAVRRDRRRHRARLAFRRTVTRGAVAALVLASLYASVFIVVPFVGRRAYRAVELGVQVSVWLALAVAEGLDVWAIVWQVAEAAASALATPTFATTLIALEVVGALALYALYRVLSGERESIQ
jgi:hypothetical protein